MNIVIQEYQREKMKKRGIFIGNFRESVLIKKEKKYLFSSHPSLLFSSRRKENTERTFLSLLTSSRIFFLPSPQIQNFIVIFLFFCRLENDFSLRKQTLERQIHYEFSFDLIFPLNLNEEFLIK